LLISSRNRGMSVRSSGRSCNIFPKSFLGFGQVI
jgi:hypothetical protein